MGTSTSLVTCALRWHPHLLLPLCHPVSSKHLCPAGRGAWVRGQQEGNGLILLKLGWLQGELVQGQLLPRLCAFHAPSLRDPEVQ